MQLDDHDLLIGKLAVHYKLLTKEQLAEIIGQFRQSGSHLPFDAYLVAEDHLAPEVLAKLRKAREVVLAKRSGRGAGEDAPVPAAPEAPLSPPPSPVAPSAEPATEGLPAVAASEPLPALVPDGVADETAPIDIGSTVGEEPPSIEVVPITTPAEDPSADPAEVEPESAAASDPVPVLVSEPESEPASLLAYDIETSLDQLLTQTVVMGASDLHLHAGAPLKLRLNGHLQDAHPEVLDTEACERLILGILDAEQQEQLRAHKQLDFAYQLDGVGRFRANAYRQQRGLDAVLRAIPPEPPTFASLGLPDSLSELMSFHQGIVLITGPAGCGKSSTMAAMVELLNQDRPDHVLTVEDPIEYVFQSKSCLINQRQVGPHTASFARALRAALREDPDVIAIGELRDLETISLALTAAETGHLVLGTLHTSSAIRTINRLLGVFPPEQQSQIRTMVSESLRAVVSQRLLARADGNGRVPALEVLINNKAVGNLIRDSKTFQLRSVMQTGMESGMCLLDHSLRQLVAAGTVTLEEARYHAEEPEKLEGAL